VSDRAINPVIMHARGGGRKPPYAGAF